MSLLIGIIGVIVIIYMIWQWQELKKFQVTHYEMYSEKTSRVLKIAVISDLHSFSYGKDNERLLQAVREASADLVLIPGDLIVTAVAEKYGISLDFVKRLCTLGVPVVFSNGNHETRATLPDADCTQEYLRYREGLIQAGVIILNQESIRLNINGETVCISGLELPLSAYEKWKKPYLEEGYTKAQLGEASRDHLQILLAHHPAFAEQYAAWGADVTVCGHNHGGLVCIPGIGSIISPQFMLFPKYDAGEFTIDGRKVYISRGLGTHTIHIRIFNRAQLPVITIKPEKQRHALQKGLSEWN